MVFKSRVGAVIFSILLLGSTSNGWGVNPSSEEPQSSKRITRRITSHPALDEVYDNRNRPLLRYAIDAINCLAPLIIVSYSAYLAYLKGQEDES